ncbi:MAG: hypothetical protein WCO43_01550 [Chitinophagia bacterium]
MKNLSKLILLLLIAGMAFTSCSSTKGRGCPTTNPNYFRQGS